MEMDARMSQFYGQSAQLGEEFLNPFQSEFLLQTAGIPDADDGFSVDFPVVRLVEITGDDVGKASESLFIGKIRGIETGRIGVASVSLLRRVKDIPRMIGPHAGEFHVVGVLRFEEPFFERLVEAGLAVVPIPVPDQYVDAAVFAEFVVDLPGRRQAFIQFSQQRCPGLLMAFEPGTCTSDEVVFGPSGGIELVVEGRSMIIRKCVAGYGQTFGFPEQ